MKIQKAIVFFVSISSKGESSPLKTPFVGERIMEEKGKLIVFFLSRIGSGAWPLVNPLFSCVFCDSGVNPLSPLVVIVIVYRYGCVYWGGCVRCFT